MSWATRRELSKRSHKGTALLFFLAWTPVAAQDAAATLPCSYIARTESAAKEGIFEPHAACAGVDPAGKVIFAGTVIDPYSGKLVARNYIAFSQVGKAISISTDLPVGPITKYSVQVRNWIHARRIGADSIACQDIVVSAKPNAHVSRVARNQLAFDLI